MQEIVDHLYLGNLKDVTNWAKHPECEPNIIIYFGQHVPTGLCHSCYPTFIHIPLKDGENIITKLANVIQITYSIVESYDGKIMISCRAGLSRSVVMITVVYALTKNVDFDDAFEYIKNKCPQSIPKQNLLSQAKQIVEELKRSI